MNALLKLHSEKTMIDEFINQSSNLLAGNQFYSVYPIHITDLQDWQQETGFVLIEKLYDLTRRGFIQDMSPSLWQDTKYHLETGEHLYLVCNESIVAYGVFNFWTKDAFSILYLSGIIVDPDHQGKGISSSLLGIVMEDFNPQLLAARTQNPVMYESIRRSCGKVYPADSIIPPVDIQTVGQFIAVDKLNMVNYDQVSMLGKGTYGSCLYGSEPVSRNSIMEYWFKGEVDLSNGDAMIIVGVR